MARRPAAGAAVVAAGTEPKSTSGVRERWMRWTAPRYYNIVEPQVDW